MKLKSIKRYFILLTLGGFIFTSLHFYYNTFVFPHLQLRKFIQQPADAIIVPGVQYDGKDWNTVMKWRVHWSVLLYRRGLAKNIIYSGSAVYTPYAESKIMALYANRMGVPKENIFIEYRAEHTTENLFYSWLLAEKYGFERVAFASDPFQCNLIKPYIKEFELDVELLPIVLPMLTRTKMLHYDIPAKEGLVKDFISIENRETPDEREFYSKGGRVRELLRKKAN